MTLLRELIPLHILPSLVLPTFQQFIGLLVCESYPKVM